MLNIIRALYSWTFFAARIHIYLVQYNDNKLIKQECHWMVHKRVIDIMHDQLRYKLNIFKNIKINILYLTNREV